MGVKTILAPPHIPLAPPLAMETLVTIPVAPPEGPTLTPLQALQERLESESTAEGQDRFFRRLNKLADKGTYSTATPVKRLFAGGMTKMVEALDAWVEGAQKTRRPAALPWIEAVGTKEAAYLALRVVLDGLVETRDASAVVRQIASLIQDELRMRRYKEMAPSAFGYHSSKLVQQGVRHYGRTVAAMKKSLRIKGVDTSDLEMTDTDRLHVGYKLLDVVLEVTGLCVLEQSRTKERRGWRMQSTLRPAEATLEWLDKRSERLALLSPLALPMVTPPLPWSAEDVGGYAYGLRGRYPLIRRHTTKSAGREDGHVDMEAVYTAINAAQATRWRINRDVWQVLATLKATGGHIPGAEVQDVEMPTKPEDIKTNREARKAYTIATREAHKERAKVLGEQQWLASVMSVAQRMEEHEAIYFPHSLDFRGRLYPIPPYVNPQGPDLARSLLQFADAHPVGEDGAKWIAIHLANTYGETPGGQKVSKMTLEERAQWVEDNSAVICAVAADPLVERWWQGAEEPWQCLAACFEWAGVCREGVEWRSRLPVAMDGSCNGLQHLAAMLRDERAGRAVNLTPNEMPEDVYLDVLGEVKRILAEHAVRQKDGPEGDMARRWLASGLLTRKLSKKPTMTVAYGSRVYGFRDSVREYLLSQPQSVLREHFMDVDAERMIIGPAAHYMAEVLFKAMQEAIAGPLNAMDWMQECANTLAQEAKAIEWTVPVTGMPVRQAYHSIRSRRVKTMFAGTIVMPRSAEELDKMDTTRQRNAIAPNVVHSLDAACLQLAVAMAHADGVRAFGLIHDSYACHPSEAPVLALAARRAFARLYSGDVLHDLREAWQAQTDTELPPVPERGRLDVSMVLLSDFFFA